MNSSKYLKLGVHHLSEAEVRLVQALVRLFAIGAPENFRWVFAHQHPFDAVIVDSQSPDMGTPALQGIAKVVLALSDGMPSRHAHDTLTRPIRSDRLETWLSNMQQRLHDLPGKAPALDTQHCFKLRRWPPAQLLHEDPHRVRMATLLSRRAVTVEELAKLTQQSPERCQTFVQLLRSMSLVDVTDVQAMPSPDMAIAGAGHHAPSHHHHHHHSWTDDLHLHLHLGLVGNIRKRLGI